MPSCRRTRSASGLSGKLAEKANRRAGTSSRDLIDALHQPINPSAVRRRYGCHAACPSRSRQYDQARIVSPTPYQAGLLGIVERVLELRARNAHITADAFSGPLECGCWR